MTDSATSKTSGPHSDGCAASTPSSGTPKPNQSSGRSAGLEDTAEQRAMRRGGAAGTNGYREALLQAGYLLEEETPSKDDLRACIDTLKSAVETAQRQYREYEQALKALNGERERLAFLSNQAERLEKAASLESIARHIARKHGLTLMELRGPCRAKNIALARQEAFWMARKYTASSTTQIGKYFGGRDHTTVIYGVRAHEKRMGGGHDVD